MSIGVIILIVLVFIVVVFISYVALRKRVENSAKIADMNKAIPDPYPESLDQSTYEKLPSEVKQNISQSAFRPRSATPARPASEMNMSMSPDVVQFLKNKPDSGW